MPNAPMNEQVLNIPGDPERSVTLQVTVFTPSGPGPFPLAVLNHGATGNVRPESQSRYRVTYSADYFLSRGYAVVLPMMRGYASSGGEIDARRCNMEAVGIEDAKDIRAVIDYVATLPKIDASRIVIAGQSFGGWNTLAFGTLHYPNVKGLINFAGGMIASTCRSPERTLARAVGRYGADTHIPSLWFYGDNDALFPVETWRAMYEAYSAAGGAVELVAYGKFMKNSHIMLNYPEAFRIWVPKVDAFLTRLGLPGKLVYPEYMPTDFPAPTHYAAIDDIDAVPYLNDQGRELYKRFLSGPMPRVFAVSKNGTASAHNGGFDPIAQVLSECQQRGQKCELYAADNDVIWIRPTPAPPSTHFAAIDDVAAVPYLGDKGRQAYQKFLTLKKPRAFAIAQNGGWGVASRGDDAVAQTMQLCAKTNQGCQFYAVDDDVVWPEKTTEK